MQAAVPISRVLIMRIIRRAEMSDLDFGAATKAP